MTSVHDSLLEDVIAPAQVVGRNTRVGADGHRGFKVFLDPLDRERVEDKLDAFAETYKKLTHKKVHFAFAKPSSFQKTFLEARRARNLFA